MKKIKILLIVIVAVLILLGALFLIKNYNEEEKITACLVCDSSGVDDKSFNAEAWKGILKFYGDTVENPSKEGKYYAVSSCPRSTQHLETLETAVQQNYDLLIVTGFSFSEALDKLSLQYPQQKFLSIDYTGDSRPNVLSYIFDMSQASYLVGAMAALQAKAEGNENPEFGFIGGYNNEIIKQFERGYIQGIHAVSPKSIVVTRYIGSWIDVKEAQRQAESWYDDGVYAVFSAAGLAGTGTINAAKELRRNGKNVWAIGVDSDQYEQGIYAEGKSAVLTSALKLVNIAAIDGLEVVAGGTFSGNIVELDLSSGGVGYTVNNTELKPEVLSAVEQMKQDIIMGKIKIQR